MGLETSCLVAYSVVNVLNASDFVQKESNFYGGRMALMYCVAVGRSKCQAVFVLELVLHLLVQRTTEVLGLVTA